MKRCENLKINFFFFFFSNNPPPVVSHHALLCPADVFGELLYTLL